MKEAVLPRGAYVYDSIEDGASPYEKKQWAKASKALSNAIQRCTNPNNKDFKNYGAQGIKVLLTLNELIDVIGLPPNGSTLDRIDPHGHYEASNVRWASKAVQVANKKASPAGSTPSLNTLIAQNKFVLQQEGLRPKITEAWWLALEAFNTGSLTEHKHTLLADHLQHLGKLPAILGTHEVIVEGVMRPTFRLPSLTLPNALVDACGPRVSVPDAQVGERYLRHGLLYRLREVESAANIPTAVYSAINRLLKDGEQPGLALVGRPTEHGFSGGWFETWMLAAASRLARLGKQTGLFPALTCLALLKEFGGPHNWDYVRHPLLDARLLFIPDFQLDCGPSGYVSNYDFGALERLLNYRTDCGHKTVVGVQAPNKLTGSLQKILLGNFDVQSIPNQPSQQLALTFSGKAAKASVKSDDQPAALCS